MRTRTKRKLKRTGTKLPVHVRLRGTRTSNELIRIFLLLAAFLCGIAEARMCLAQALPPVAGNSPEANPTRSIVGTVVDDHGAPVPHAIVLLKDMKSLQIRSYIAQNDGSYHFYGLSGDINYQLRAEANGLTSPEKTVSVFNSRKIVKLNLKLNKKMKT